MQIIGDQFELTPPDASLASSTDLLCCPLAPVIAVTWGHQQCLDKESSRLGNRR